MIELENPVLRRRSKLFGKDTPNNSITQTPESSYSLNLIKEINDWKSLLKKNHQRIKQLKDTQNELDTSYLTEWQNQYLEKGLRIQDSLMGSNDIIMQANAFVEQKCYLQEKINYINENTNSVLTNIELDIFKEKFC